MILWLEKYRWEISLALLIAGSLFLNPYFFGVADHTYKIPFLTATYDPSLYEKDITVAMKHFYVSYFYALVYPWQKMLGLELSFFLLHILTRILFFLGIYLIAQYLSGRKLAGILAVLFLLFPKIVSGGVLTFDFLLEERSIALTLLLFACLGLFKGRPAVAGFLAGAAANIHLVSTANYCVLAGAYLLLGFFDEGNRKRAGRDAALFLLFLVLGLIPVLLKKYLTHETNVFVLIDPEWLSMIKLRSPHHWLPPYPRLIFQAVLGGMMFYFLRSSKVIGLNASEKLLRAYLSAFLAMIAGGAFATIFSSFYPLLIGLNLSFYRTDWFFVVMFYIAVACWLCSVLRRSKILIIPVVVAFSYLGIKFQFLLLMGIGFFSLLNKRWIDGGEPDEKSVDRFGFKRLMLLIVLFFSIAIALGHRPQFDNPMRANTGLNIEVQKWLKENTAPTSLIMAPPYEDDFRIFSERATFGSWKDWTYNVLDREFAFVMAERLEDACGIGVTVCHDGKQCLEACRGNYLSLDADKIRHLAAKYDFSHFLTENKNLTGLTKRYENEKYAVYEVESVL